MRARWRHYGTLLTALALVIVSSSLAAGEATLAGVSIGQEAKEIVRLYGECTDKESDSDLGATYWFYPPDSHGTKLMFEVMPGDIVTGISATGGPSPAIKTAKGVQLGDPLAKVTERYGRQTPRPAGEGAPESRLLYGEENGLAFTLRDERVVQIDLIGDPDVVMPKVAAWMVNDLRTHGREEAEARAETGAWLKQRGYHTVAIAEYQRALKLTPKSWEIMNNIGSAYLSMDEPARAREWFARGVAEKPDNVTLQYNLGNALCALGRPGEGRPHLTKAIELAGDSDREVAAQALRVLGNVLDEEGRPDEAIECYQKALRLATDKRNLAVIWYDLGVTYESKGKDAQARQAFQTALSHDPRNQEAREALARLKARTAAPATRE